MLVIDKMSHYMYQWDKHKTNTKDKKKKDKKEATSKDAIDPNRGSFIDSRI